MKNNNSPLWPFLIPFAFVVIAIIGLRIIPLLIIGYIIYKAINNLKRMNGDFFERFRQKPVELKPDKKGVFSSFTPPQMFEIKFKHIAGFFAVLLFIFVIIDGLVSVPPGYVAVIFDRGRGVLEEEYPEGLHLKIPFWQEAQLFTTRKQIFTMAGDYQGVQDENAVEGRSKDGQDVTVDVSINFQINGIDASHMRRDFLTEEGYRNTIVRPAARSVVYDSVSKFNALELVAEKRSEFRDLIHANLEKVYGENKVILREVLVRNVTFSEGFSRAVEEKQIAEQNIKTAENRKIEAEQLKQKKIIEAEADAQSIRLKGEALRQNPEVIQLEFVNKMAPSINWGILPDGALPLIDLKSLQGN